MGGEIRRRLCRCSVTKRISSSSSSSSSCSLPTMRCSIDSTMPKPLSSSGGRVGLDCDSSSMLSTRSNFRTGFGRGVGRGVGSACGRWCRDDSSTFALLCSSALCVRRCGAMTNLFAGVDVFNGSSGLSRVAGGVCTASTLRRLE